MNLFPDNSRIVVQRKHEVWRLSIACNQFENISKNTEISPYWMKFDLQKIKIRNEQIKNTTIF